MNISVLDEVMHFVAVDKLSLLLLYINNMISGFSTPNCNIL